MTTMLTTALNRLSFQESHRILLSAKHLNKIRVIDVRYNVRKPVMISEIMTLKTAVNAILISARRRLITVIRSIK